MAPKAMTKAEATAGGDLRVLHSRPYEEQDSYVRKASDDEAAAARSRIVEALPRIAGNAGLVSIVLDDGKPLIVDAHKGKVLEALPAGRQPDCTLRSSPMAMIQIVAGQMDPRYAMLYGRLHVDGPVATATRFCDSLAGRPKQAAMTGDPAQYPTPTSDWALAKEQFVRFGYCLVRGALDAGQIAALRSRLVDQAQAERTSDLGWLDGNPGEAVQHNQRVWTLVNKGKVFCDLLEHPIVDYFMPEFLGEYFLLSTLHANIAGPGGRPMFLHNDQIMIQPPVHDLRFGINILWFLDEVTDANGGTRILPGSHAGDVAPADIFTTNGTIAAAGPAGTALIFDSRLWHGTGANVTDQKRHVLIAYYMRPWLRTVENYTLATRPEVLDTLSDKVKTQLGFRCTGSLGGVHGPVEGQIVCQQPNVLGELTPAR